MAAGKFGNKDVAQLILEEAAARKVDNTILDLNHNRKTESFPHEGPSALMLAAEHGRLGTARYLLENEAPYRVSRNTPGCEYENVTTALLMCVEGQQPHWSREYTKRCWRNMTDMFILDRKRSDPQDCALAPIAPKLRSSDEEYITLITMLCDHDGGKMIDMTDNFGRSALIIAAEAGQSISTYLTSAVFPTFCMGLNI